MKTILKKRISLSIMAVMVAAFTFQSCKKNDDGPGPNGPSPETALTIKKLTQSPINVSPSTYKLNGGTAMEADEAEDDYELDSFNGKFIRIAKDSKNLNGVCNHYP